MVNFEAGFYKQLHVLNQGARIIATKLKLKYSLHQENKKRNSSRLACWKTLFCVGSDFALL